MKDVVSVFTKLSVPYFLSDGSLLHLYRNCSLGTSDLDFVVQLHWWNKSSSLRLQVALQDEGFRRQDFFGEQEMIGFQESWIRQEVKVRREKCTLLNDINVSFMACCRLTFSLEHFLWTRPGATLCCGSQNSPS